MDDTLDPTHIGSRDVPRLTLVVESRGTYIVVFQLIGDGRPQGTLRLSGREQKAFSFANPVDDLVINVRFLDTTSAGQEHSLHVVDPARVWRNGTAHLVASGIWPGRTRVDWLE